MTSSKRALAVLFAALLVAVLPGLNLRTQADPHDGAANSLSSSPPDLTRYARRAVREDYLGAGLRGADAGRIVLRDAVVSNTNPALNGTDMFNDGECSIAINPSNTNEIVMTAFSGGAAPPGSAPLWHSTDGGLTWTKRFTIPAPPGTPGIPNDQTFDWGQNTLRLFGTFLSCDGVPNCNVFTGSTSDPTSGAAWTWPLDGAGNAQRTNLVASSLNVADQPWLLTNRDPAISTQDNIYIGYDDFSTPGGATMRVAAAYGNLPPNVTVDNQSGLAVPLATNPGHRLANDPRTGRMYCLYQRSTDVAPPNLKNVDYMLNRSTDAGATWSLNASLDGIVVANRNSQQAPGGKFGTVNALLGGIDHAAVDPVTGDVYCVLGSNFGATTDVLELHRVTFDAVGTAAPAFVSFVGTTGFPGVQAALPSIAIASNRNIGVIYTRFEGFSSDGFPIFSERLAISKNQGASWTEQTLVTFLSSATDNGNARQRVLGDYQQLKAVGRFFYGAFTGNGVPFGRPFANHDPIFLKAFAGGPLAEVNSTDLQFGLACAGQVKDLSLAVFNTGDEDLHVLSITPLAGDPDFTLLPNPRTPTTISPDGHVDYTIRFTPAGAAGSRSRCFRVTTDDPDRSTIDVCASGAVGAPRLNANVLDSGEGGFGTVCVGEFKDLVLELRNEGTCDLTITNVFRSAGSSDFTRAAVLRFPLILSPDSHVQIPIRFAPTSFGDKFATFEVDSNDPIFPPLLVSFTGTGGTPDIRVQGCPLDFGTVELDDAPGHLQDIQICNTGKCSLTVTGVSFPPGETEFVLVETPPTPGSPLVISPDSCVPFHVRFTPTSAGPKASTLTIISDDPDSPVELCPVTGNSAVGSVADVDAPAGLAFPPTVIQRFGLCGSAVLPAISNRGAGLVQITDVSVDDPTQFHVHGLPSTPIFLDPGDVLGDGDFSIEFHPITVARAHRATLSIEVSDPISGSVLGTVEVQLCGEGVRPGARLLVNEGGVPDNRVEKIQLQILEDHEGGRLGHYDTIAQYERVTPKDVDPGFPCTPFTYHIEIGAVDTPLNEPPSRGRPLHLRPADYRFRVIKRIAGRNVVKAVTFRVERCDFYSTLEVHYP